MQRVYVCVYIYIYTYGGAFILSINGINSGEHEHETKKKSDEQKGVENHAIRQPS